MTDPVVACIVANGNVEPRRALPVAHADASAFLEKRKLNFSSL